MQGLLRVAVAAIGKKFSIFDAAALQSDLPAMGAGTGEVDAGDGVSRVGGTAFSRVLFGAGHGWWWWNLPLQE